LAQQIAEEAKNLTKFNGFGVQVILGGTNMGAEQKRFKSQRVDILVATPGRLKDHLQTTPGFQALCSSLRVLVLDEADQLLEMGFRHDIEAILKMLPSGRGGTKGAASSTRQTLLFSATVPKEVHEIAKAAMHAEFKFIDAMDDDGDATNNQVIQHYLLTPLHLQIHVMYELIVNARKVPNYKIMV
jgi:ATP-dependent RNA helicase MSS116